MALQDDIYQDLSLIDPTHRFAGDKKFFGHTAATWMFTNEDLSLTLDSVAGRSVLGVTCSGDHIISSFMAGCTSYTAFDVSLFASLFSELKVAAVKHLTLEEFCSFFTIDEPLRFGLLLDYSEPFQRFQSTTDPDTFSPKYYQRFREDLSTTARAFFDKIIGVSMKTRYLGREITNQDIELPLALHYLNDLVMREHLEYVPYLRDHESYARAQMKVRDVEPPVFHIGSLTNLKAFAKGPFGGVYTSNTLEHVDEILDFKAQRVVLRTIGSILEPEGTCTIVVERYPPLERIATEGGWSFEYRENPREEEFSRQIVHRGCYLLRPKN